MSNLTDEQVAAGVREALKDHPAVTGEISEWFAIARHFYEAGRLEALEWVLDRNGHELGAGPYNNDCDPSCLGCWLEAEIAKLKGGE